MAPTSSSAYPPLGQLDGPSLVQTPAALDDSFPALPNPILPDPVATKAAGAASAASAASSASTASTANTVNTASTVRRVDPYHLAPEDAFYTAANAATAATAASPPRCVSSTNNGSASEFLEPRPSRQALGGSIGRAAGSRGADHRSRSRRRSRKRTWKKLLWVKQSYPDNYTDQATFLENLQRNPRLQPYDFWPLVADSTVIVQHVCSVIIFIVCFVGIFQERVSPVSVVGWGSFATCLGWLLWERWAGCEEDPDVLAEDAQQCVARRSLDSTELTRRSSQIIHGNGNGNGSAVNSWQVSPTASTASLPPIDTNVRAARPSGPELTTVTATPGSPRYPPPGRTLAPMRGSRVTTLKSGVLIYFTLLGLSPILKSLTRSTSSDSIWAMSFWLMAINIFFFDYSGARVGAHKFPVASLSTNAALMSSTVLASRLPSTGQVFSLTLFSIEVFGLFPVFRRYARHRSWRYHVALTVLLVLGAGAGVGIILVSGGNGGWPWQRALVGMFVGCLLAAGAMGGCSWWLIGLQKYKNEIYGPWDPARPVIISRRHWNDV